jgi:hypothetical protein
MLFVRVQQLATARDRMGEALRTVCVIADEAKYHVSRPILQGLGASRDKGMRVILAMQSFLDLRDGPADMNPDAVLGAVIANTPVKLVYRLEDPDTAEWFARKGGTVRVREETQPLSRNGLLTETRGSERSLRETEHYLMDPNRLLHLPPGWAVLYGLALAQTCYVSPYRVAKCREAITPVGTPNSSGRAGLLARPTEGAVGTEHDVASTGSVHPSRVEAAHPKALRARIPTREAGTDRRAKRTRDSGFFALEPKVEDE